MFYTTSNCNLWPSLYIEKANLFVKEEDTNCKTGSSLGYHKVAHNLQLSNNMLATTGRNYYNKFPAYLKWISFKRS
jgi:hypothetical protein